MDSDYESYDDEYDDGYDDGDVSVYDDVDYDSNDSVDIDDDGDVSVYDDVDNDSNDSGDIDPVQGEEDGGFGSECDHGDNYTIDVNDSEVVEDSKDDDGFHADYHYDSTVQDLTILCGGDQVYDSYDSEETEQDSEDDDEYHGDHHYDSMQDFTIIRGGDQVYDSYDSKETEQRGKVYLEFDGASKGNPGRAGGGAVLKSEDGTVITRVRQGLGTATNNDAEYEALKCGLKTARDMGYGMIHAKGDSKLVYKQVTGQWQTRNERMAKHCDEARQLINQFKEFKLSHHPRGHNADADTEANRAVNLPKGQIEIEDNPHYWGPY